MTWKRSTSWLNFTPVLRFIPEVLTLARSSRIDLTSFSTVFTETFVLPTEAAVSLVEHPDRSNRPMAPAITDTVDLVDKRFTIFSDQISLMGALATSLLLKLAPRSY